ncbi:hypothetical protein F0562_001514 [Nyssa sinensis]|uniref:Uncharacterized protein n=1 Tax=Nyssa sinensis TaxID=561372 RepID=A0A5J5C784_9ASTE|nr:hypothetical protein F0562_001514 [Nyssa sinensis]
MGETERPFLWNLSFRFHSFHWLPITPPSPPCSSTIYSFHWCHFSPEGGEQVLGKHNGRIFQFGAGIKRRRCTHKSAIDKPLKFLIYDRIGRTGGLLGQLCQSQGTASPISPPPPRTTSAQPASLARLLGRWPRLLDAFIWFRLGVVVFIINLIPLHVMVLLITGSRTPVPAVGNDNQLYGAQHYRYPTTYFQPITPTSGPYNPGLAAPTKGDISISSAANQTPLLVDTAGGNSNGIINGGAAKGNNGVALVRPIYWNSSFKLNGSYGRGALPGGIPAFGYQDPRFGFDGLRSPIV